MKFLKDPFTQAVLLFCIGWFIIGCSGPHHTKPPPKLTPQQKHERHVQEQQSLAPEERDAPFKPPAPPGVTQLEASVFFVKKGYYANIRHLCIEGNGTNGSAGIHETEYHRDGSMIVYCQSPQHRYHDPPEVSTPQ